MSAVDAIPEPPGDWNEHLVDQLADHWTLQLRPGLQGLTDDEYFWEPTPGAWSLRPRGTERTELALGSGEMVMECAHPEPHDPPLTTIAWRLAHIAVWVLGIRNANHFAGPETGFATAEYAPTASASLAQLDEAIERWFHGVRSCSASSTASGAIVAMAGDVDLAIDGLSGFRPIGSGGFATVYAAIDDDFGRTVAVKVLHSVDDDGRRRFDRERRALGHVGQHPNVVGGGSLADVLVTEGRLGWDRAMAYLLPIVDALGCRLAGRH